MLFIHNIGRISLVLLFFISGCSVVPTLPEKPLEIGSNPTLSECETLFDHLDQAVAEMGTTDSQAAPIPGFPYLGSDRFLASFRELPLSNSQFVSWVDHLQQLREQGRKVEMDNLPPRVQQLFPPYKTVQECGNLLRKRDLPLRKQELSDAIYVPPEYQTWKRILGLYWFSAWPIKMGANKLHKEIMETYSTPLEKLKVKGKLIRYLPPKISEPLNAQEISAIIQNSAYNPLVIPEPTSKEMERLYATFAPIWQVDTVSNDDKIGAVIWRGSMDKAIIDTKIPTVYRYSSHTLYQGKVLLQLNYIVWFPARPSTSKMDILAGHLDGLLWRVTLSPDGTPLAYDTIHNCGCYHLFYPTSKVCLLPADGMLQEPAFSPQAAPEPGENPALRVAHTSHFVDRVSQQPQNKGQTKTYVWADYDTLRSLPLNGQRKSLFQANGIVSGTQRGERWILWPMGIPAPGEMRQRGHHATAFFGRRHFDDSDIMDRSFKPRYGNCP